MPKLRNHLKAPSTGRRILCYGPEKMKKTWWCGTAAEAGYNVIIADCDRGSSILANLSPAAQERVFIFDIGDEANNGLASMFMAFFLRGHPFYWDEEKRQAFPRLLRSPGLFVDPWNVLNRNCLFVLDSWSAFVRSVAARYAFENKIDMAILDQDKNDYDKRALYGQCGSFALWAFNQLRALPCHVAIVGHQTVYEKRKHVAIGGGKTREVVEWARTQIISTSGPNAMAMGDGFDDILRFEAQGARFRINTNVESMTMGGARGVKPDIYDWNKFQFKDYAEMTGMNKPAENLPLPEVYFPFTEPGAQAPTESAAEVTPIQPGKSRRLKLPSRA